MVSGPVSAPTALTEASFFSTFVLAIRAKLSGIRQPFEEGKAIFRLVALEFGPQKSVTEEQPLLRLPNTHAAPSV